MKPHYLVFRDRPGDAHRYTLESWDVGMLHHRVIVSSWDPGDLVAFIPDGYTSVMWGPSGMPVGAWVHNSVGGV